MPSPPTLAHGKICYIEIPALDPQRSADFYAGAFGWQIRRRGDGALAFDDTTGQVSGAFVRSRPPSGAPGLLIYIMVADLVTAMHGVTANAGEITHRPNPDAPETVALFRDPAGNTLGLYQDPSLAKAGKRPL